MLIGGTDPVNKLEYFAVTSLIRIDGLCILDGDLERKHTNINSIILSHFRLYYFYTYNKMSSINGADQNNEDTFESEPQVPRRGRTPSIIVQTLNLNPQGGASITSESIELNGDDDIDVDSLNNTSNNRNSSASTSNCSPAHGTISACERRNIDEISQQLRDYTTNDEQQQARNNQNERLIGLSSQSSTSSLYNSNSPLRNNIRQPPEPRPPPSVGNRRLSLNIGSTAPRRLSLNVDSLPSFATAASLSQTSSSSNNAPSPGSQSPVNTAGNATGSLRNKVALKPGHSLMGWIAYTSTAKNLSGTNGKIIDVTPEELAKHDKLEDCWVALKDNVYNVTTYLQYHPGGVEELMRAAGKDATELFNEVHMWVNFESILAKCLVGPFKNSTNNNNTATAG